MLLFNKALLLLLLSLSISTNCVSQELGYKDLKIGSYLFSPKLKSTYKYSVSKLDGTIFHLESIWPQFICDEKVAYLDIKINSVDSTIEYIQLYTNEINIIDLADYNKKYRTMCDCIINTIGKASYYDNGNDKLDGQQLMMWSLSNDKIILVLNTYSLSVWDKNVKRNYNFIWSKAKEPKKMW